MLGKFKSLEEAFNTLNAVMAGFPIKKKQAFRITQVSDLGQVAA
jgi:hypothetical protein